MRDPSHLPLTVAWLLAAWSIVGLVRGEDRYVAAFADGTSVSGNELHGWWDERDRWQLNGRKLFSTDNPVRCVIDTTAAVALSAPYVQFAGGDILPCHIEGFRPADPHSLQPAHLIVTPRSPVYGYDGPVFIRADCVARIVMKQPQAQRDDQRARLSDGRVLSPRSVKFEEDGVRLLTDEGVVTATFDSIAELTVPGVAQLNALLEKAERTPGTLNRVARLVTDHGAVISCSTDRILTLATPKVHVLGQTKRDLDKVVRGQAKTYELTEGKQKHSSDYVMVQVMQPAWALGALFVPGEAIARRCYRAPGEIPLRDIPAEVLSGKSFVGQGAYLLLDSLEAASTATTSGDLSPWWNITTRADSAVAFDLPARAATFAAQVDLAHATGGCVKLRIHRDAADGAQLWASDFVTGGDNPLSIGPLDIRGAQRLVLVTDAAHQGRPRGADPLDIRDTVIWQRPMVALASSQASAENLLAALPGDWPAWRLSLPQGERASLMGHWFRTNGHWRNLLLLPRNPNVKFTATVTIEPTRDVLQLQALELSGDKKRFRGRRQKLQPPAILTADGEPVPSFTEALRNSEERGGPLLLYHWWDLQAFRGRRVRLELRVDPENFRETDAWTELSFVSPLPRDGEKAVRPDVSLTSLEPDDLSSHKGRGDPLPSQIPTGRRGAPIRLMGKLFEDGYGMMRNSAVSFRVQLEYTHFVGLVGACQVNGGPYYVLLDDNVAWEHGVLESTDRAVPVRVEIPPGTEKLTLQAGPEGGYDGYSAWVSAGFLVRE